jgi:trimethylguanosine synthase
MGKQTRNLAGLSRFVVDALRESSGHTVQDHSAIAENTAVAATSSHPASKRQNGDKRPAKRRKTETTQSKRSRYDATGLVPHYRTASEVPDHLKKCPSLSNCVHFDLIDSKRTPHSHRLFSEETVFLAI